MRSEPFSEVSKAQRRSTRAHSTATTTAWDTALGGGAGLVRLRELGEWCVFDMLSRGLAAVFDEKGVAAFVAGMFLWNDRMRNSAVLCE
jgi:hypothetical protein